MPSLAAVAARSVLLRNPDAQQLLGSVPVHCYVKLSEIDEFTTELMLSHVKLSFVPKARQRLNEVDMNVLLQFDQRLSDFEKSLPKDLISVNGEGEPELRRQRSLLHLRLVHSRLLLYRPLLVRFCFAQSRQDDHFIAPESDFSEQTLENGAKRCLASAQRMTELACDCRELENQVGGLPWWYYVFYLLIAAQHIVAAQVRPGVMSEGASDSFRKALSAAQGYEHLSPCIGDCISVLDKMWQSVTGMHQTTIQGGFDIEETWNYSFDEVFQQWGVEGEYPIFDLDWLNNPLLMNQGS